MFFILKGQFVEFSGNVNGYFLEHRKLFHADVYHFDNLNKAFDT